MSFAGRVVPLRGALPAVRYRWDPETEILAGNLDEVETDSGFTGTIELEDPNGAFLALDVRSGTVCALEMVVWPEVTTVPDLGLPPASQEGRLAVPARSSQPGIALLELEVPLSAERSPDESVIHLCIGRPRPATAVRLATDLIVETDTAGDLVGFWLLNVPPFPGGGAVA